MKYFLASSHFVFDIYFNDFCAIESLVLWAVVVVAQVVERVRPL